MVLNYIYDLSVAEQLVLQKRHEIKPGQWLELCEAKEEAPRVLDTKRLKLKADQDLSGLPPESLLSYIKNRAGIKNTQPNPKYEYSLDRKQILVTFQSDIGRYTLFTAMAFFVSSEEEKT